MRLSSQAKRRLARTSQLTVRLGVQVAPKTGKPLPVLPLDVETRTRRK